MVHKVSPLETLSFASLFSFIPTLGSIISSLVCLPAPKLTESFPISKASIAFSDPSF